MKVPTTESETPFHRGRKVGMLQALGQMMAVVYEANPETYEQIKDDVAEWAEIHAGYKAPDAKDV